jgi:hypothetical protein
MPERDLDAVIEVVLRTDTFVTARQKRLAWDRLQKRAAHQTMWPPLSDPKPRSLLQTLKLTWSWVRRGAAILLTDEGGYERARKERQACYSIAASAASPTQVMIERSPQTGSQN